MMTGRLDDVALDTTCWCGWDHRYLDYDSDGNPFDVRDAVEDEDE